MTLIFTSQSNLVTESGVYSPLHANCHHLITYVKFKLNVIYPAPNEREVWHYKLVNSECIQRAIADYDWEKAFYNIDVNKKVMFFNETVLNIIRNFIPHEVVTFDDRNPSSITIRIKKTINDKNLAFKRYVKNKGSANNNSYLEKFSSLQKNLGRLIETSKQE